MTVIISYILFLLKIGIIVGLILDKYGVFKRKKRTKESKKKEV